MSESESFQKNQTPREQRNVRNPLRQSSRNTKFRVSVKLTRMGCESYRDETSL
jgi:hypothetical protein